VFLPVMRFELRYQLGSPAFWVTSILFFLLAFGAAASDNISIGGEGGNVLVNSPFTIALTCLVMSVFAVFIVTAFVANVVIRDDETRFAPLVHSTRISKRDYLLGRFTGAYLVGLLAFASVPLGNLVGSLMPWLDPETVGPVQLSHYLQVWLLLCGPTLFVLSAGFFALATATRSLMATYVGVVLFIVLYFITRGLLSRPEFVDIAALLDPFGLSAFAEQTRYWTAADRNTRLPEITGMLLYNRLLWCGVALALLALAWRLYRVEGRKPRRAKAGAAAASAPEALTPAALLGDVPTLAVGHAPSRPGRAGPAAFWTLVRFDLRMAFRNPGYVVLLFIGFVNAGAALWFADELYGTAIHPVTRVMISALSGSFAIIPLIIAIYYAGELVWSDRERRMHELRDATPAPDWTFVVPKLLAVSLVLLSTLAFSVVAAVLVQLLKGHTDLQLDHYALWYLLPWTIDVIIIASLAVFVQVLVPHKFAGWMVMLLVIVGQTALAGLGLEHNLFQYGGTPAVPLSDMNGQGDFVWHAAWFRLYWVAFALLLAVLAQALWRRGAIVALRPRLSRLPARLRGTAGVVAGFAVAVLVGTGGFIYYNTNVLNEYRTSDEQEAWLADAEKTLLPFESLPQPRITEVRLDVDLFPRESRVLTNGTYVLENRTAQPLEQVHVGFPRDLQVQVLAVQGAQLERALDKFNYHIFRFATPLQPGQRATLDFTTLREQRGFANRGNDTRVVANGTFLNNSEIAPVLGVDRGGGLRDRATRRKYGLPAELRPAPLEDEAARAFNVLRRDSDWVLSDITVHTDADQTAVAPGYVVSDEVKAGRRTVRFRPDAPIGNFFSIQSARYEVRRDRWNDVQLVVYHDAAHAWNIDRMLRAMKLSLDYFTREFSPFQFRELRILEFPAYASFAQSFAGTIPYSESIGFIMDQKKPSDVDMVTYVTAHEIAHQWWGHQVVSADKQGATFLIESLSQYSALMVMEREVGPEQIRKFLRYELDRYLRARGGEALEELPLQRVENQQYIHYQKGSLALYLLKERIGEAAVNRALRSLLQEFALKAAPYPDPRDLIRRLKAEAGPQHESLIVDLFERITLYDTKVVAATTREVAQGRWETTLEIEAVKRYADGRGVETEAPLDEPFDVGLFTAEPGEADFTADSVLVFRTQPLRSGRNTVVLESDREPLWAGADPYNKYVDRNSGDNLKRVSGP
jgi:ABC-type transport system involved in multi-copper enzyme maturation permease subunit